MCKSALLPANASASNTWYGIPNKRENGHPQRGISALADAQTTSTFRDLCGHVSGRAARVATVELLFSGIDGHACFRLHAHLVSPRGALLSVGVDHLVVLYPQVDRTGRGGGGGGSRGARGRSRKGNKMTNDEFPMTKETRIPKPEDSFRLSKFRALAFELLSAFDIRHLEFP